MMKLIIRGALLILIVSVIAYVAMCTYGNFFGKSQGNIDNPEMPSSQEAGYYLLIKNTGTVILTNKVEVAGDKVKERAFILHGYWEQDGPEFVYRDITLTISEQIFGEIGLRKR